ncbi:MAG: beta-propeller domain-containing protein [Deltaproteobacteria bacterium]|nr:beta-propeller domain-containing protein [Deltaproteobacteria bacterium]
MMHGQKKRGAGAPLPVLFAIMCALAACSSGGGFALEPVDLEPRVMTSAALTVPASCSELEERLRRGLSQEMRVMLLQAEQALRGSMSGGIPVPVLGGAEVDMALGGAGRSDGPAYSGTNNQEAAADEGDIVKTDGTYLYVLGPTDIVILEIPEPGDLAVRSRTAVEGWPLELLLDGNTAVVVSAVSPWDLPEGHPLRSQPGGIGLGDWGSSPGSPGAEPAIDIAGPGYWWNSIIKIAVLDVTDRTGPAVLHEIYTEGDYRAARLTDGVVRVVTFGGKAADALNYWPELPDWFWEGGGSDLQRWAAIRSAVIEAIGKNDRIIARMGLADFAPQSAVSDGDGGYDLESLSGENCQNFALPEDSWSRSFTTIRTLDLSGDLAESPVLQVATGASHVYSSGDTLLVADEAFASWWFWDQEILPGHTNLHRFHLDGANTAYTGSGRVEGTLYGPFALSERENRVRIAVTSGGFPWWWGVRRVEPVNHVYVMEGGDSLEVTGHLGGIARGESIWAARFLEDKAFLVTFRNIDPLWAIDLADPAAPSVAGHVEVPGVSTYIHPLAGDRLLTVGFAVDTETFDWSTQVALFDVSDFAAPVQSDTLDLGALLGGGWSEATWEHKAFQYWPPHSLLAIPMERYRFDSDDYEYSTTLELVEVDGGTLSHAGSLAQDAEAGECEDPLFYCMPNRVRRSVFVGDHVYLIGTVRVSAFDLDTLEETATAELTAP